MPLLKEAAVMTLDDVDSSFFLTPTAEYDAMQCNALRCDAMQCNAMPEKQLYAQRSQHHSVCPKLGLNSLCAALVQIMVELTQKQGRPELPPLYELPGQPLPGIEGYLHLMRVCQSSKVRHVDRLSPIHTAARQQETIS